MEAPGLFDTHVHTELAYCAVDTNVAGCLERAKLLDLEGLCFTEHAGQLYVTADDFWSAKFIFDPDIWKAGPRERMDEYFRLTDPHRGQFVRIGLEAEIDRDGVLTVRLEDRNRLDLLLGAVHWIPEDTDAMTDAQFTRAFLRTTERLLAAGVNILAHPMRAVARFRPIAGEVNVAVADMLAATDTAAEINFHLNTPELPFVAACIKRGVKLALGSDTHELRELGNLGPAITLLREAAGSDDVDYLLYRP